MFSGIIAAVGRIVDLASRPEDDSGGLRLTIDAGALELADVALGDSIACNGVCLTVISRTDSAFQVDVSRETLSCTVGLQQPGEINLEKALRLADRLGGHLVSGHVDGVGEVLGLTPVGEEKNGDHLLRIRAPKALAGYIARKGSIAVNGVSLTTNTVTGNEFTINLIPHTLAQTTLKHLGAGSQVNLEIDLIARYCERLLAWQAEEGEQA